MKVSIITVVYNNEKTIEDAILSVAEQIGPTIEHIIIDGKSTDKTCQIIDSHRDKIATFISEPDNGIYDAMNKGITVATGDIIGILNSDDIYSNSNVLQDVLREFEKESALDIVYGDLDYVSANDSNKIVRRWRSKDYYESFFEDGNVPPHPTLFVRSRVYASVGFFNSTYSFAADYEFMLRILKRHCFKSKHLPKTLVKMRLGGATNKNMMNVFRGNYEIVRSWRDNNLSVPFLLMPKRIIKRISQFFLQ